MIPRSEAIEELWLESFGSGTFGEWKSDDVNWEDQNEGSGSKRLYLREENGEIWGMWVARSPTGHQDAERASQIKNSKPLSCSAHRHLLLLPAAAGFPPSFPLPLVPRDEIYSWRIKRANGIEGGQRKPSGVTRIKEITQTEGERRSERRQRRFRSSKPHLLLLLLLFLFLLLLSSSSLFRELQKRREMGDLVFKCSQSGSTTSAGGLGQCGYDTSDSFKQLLTQIQQN